MRFVSYLFIICSGILLAACQPAESSTSSPQTTIDTAQYTLTAIPNSAVQRAERVGAMGQVLESGYLLDGKQHGTWTSYDADGKHPRKIVSYADGILDGIYLEFDDQNRMKVMAHYRNNVMDGQYGSYQMGRPEITVNYVDGKMDGVYAEYDYTRNRLKREIHYKKGLKHGPLRHFNEEGEMVIEYLYENDERISGGIVE